MFAKIPVTIYNARFYLVKADKDKVDEFTL